MKQLTPGLVVIGIALVVAGCGPSTADVEKEFKRKNPKSSSVEAYVSEGWSDTVYFTINYRVEGSTVAFVDCWQYTNPKSGGWNLERQWTADKAKVSDRFCK